MKTDGDMNMKNKNAGNDEFDRACVDFTKALY
jgi:hypothetical protein